MYVCASLDTDPLSGAQTCIEWVEQTGLLPALSISDANLIIIAYATMLATIWGLRRVLSIFR